MTLAQHLRATLTIGGPLIGGQLAQTLITLTDTLMMGWYGAEELAAVALGGSYFHVVLILGMGFGLAVMPMVAAAASNEDVQAVRRVTRMGLWIGILFSLAILPALWFSGAILLALGQAPQIASDAQDYLRIAGLAILPAVLGLVLRSHLSALERPRIVLWAWLGGAALNAGMNWVLIFGNLGAPELGIQGAALASLGTQILIFIVLAVFAARARGLSRYTLFARFWRPDPEVFASVFRLGWPISLTLLAESGLFVGTMIMMGWIGTVEIAAHGIALQIVSVTFMVHIGLSSAATVRAGHAWARGDAEGLRLAAIAALMLSGLMVAVTILLLVTVPGLLVGLFVEPGDPLRPEIVALGAQLLIVAAFFQLADAAQVMALGLLRGVQDTRVPMIHAVVSYWLVGMPAAYLLGFEAGFGAPGIWWGLVVGLVLAGGLMMARFWRGAARRAVPRPPLEMPPAT
ncbi:MATE family efflux transporter [Roseibacterium sp. SDUM158016]|uniref:MATE family efflux transporter n=1 Tax=Roseicyclus sediminis TaxID=2980997 RepID=UPI0021D2A16F|nr:MATE family efflux transporter [Roseibacterium sp. SDUM158016]MCU4653575.1 MATE family efflux transporter [Roseibacterium sp. SDUM158016]